MSNFDTLHFVLLLAIVALMIINASIHTQLKDLSLTLAMTFKLIKDVAEGKAKLVRRANGDIALEVNPHGK